MALVMSWESGVFEYNPTDNSPLEFPLIQYVMNFLFKSIATNIVA